MAVFAVAVVGMLAGYGVDGWKLLLLSAALLAVWFRPRGDAAARRERRIERQSDALARQLDDTIEVVGRAVRKISPRGEPAPPLPLRESDLP